MTDEVTVVQPTPGDVAARSKNGPVPRKPQRPKPADPNVKMDPEAFVTIAKDVVLDNYNNARDEAHAPALTAGDLFIVEYARTLQNWRVVVTSPVARRLLWEVTYNNYRNEVYINVYQKINSVKVPLGEQAQS